MRYHDFLNFQDPEWLRDKDQFPIPSYTSNDSHNTEADQVENFLLMEYIMPMAATIRRLMAKVETLEQGYQYTKADACSTYNRDESAWTRLPDDLIGKTGKCRRCGDAIWWQKCTTRNGVKNLPFYPGEDGATTLTLHPFDCEERLPPDIDGNDLPF